MVKSIQLTQNQYAIIDDEDFERVAKFKWCVRKTPSGFYAVRGDWRKQKLIGMHRFVLDAPDGIWVDHVNGNTLDNRKSNLRLSTPGQNAQNRKMAKKNLYYKGVHWHRKDSKWQATITLGKKQYYIGNFDSPEDAARAYDKTAIEKFGAFAKTNFPKEEYK